ncbi:MULTISPECIES: hypothetical protein [unclassified Microbulbifer]|nr:MULTISPECIES: hypothetical protein [unclassified Microbulbifer]
MIANRPYDGGRLTLLVLGAPLAIPLFTLLAAGVIGLIWKSNTPIDSFLG